MELMSNLLPSSPPSSPPSSSSSSSYSCLSQSPKSPTKFTSTPIIYENDKRKKFLFRLSRFIRKLFSGSPFFKPINLILFFSVFVFLLYYNGWIQFGRNNLIEQRIHHFYAHKINSILIENKRLKLETNILSNLQHQNCANILNHKTYSETNNQRFKSFYFGSKSTNQVIGYYDIIRGRLDTSLHDMWNFLSKKTQHLPNGYADRKYLYELYQMMSAMVDQLGTRDQLWRYHRQLQLGKLIHDKIDELQNPKNCFEAKKLYCEVDKVCGFGCLVHHLAYCLIAAMATNRTLILTRSYRLPIDTTFFSINSICAHTPGSLILPWDKINPRMSPKMFEEIDSIELPFVDFLNESNLTKFRPLAVPEQLAPWLTELSQNPFALFVGHILDYILQPNDSMIQRFNSYWKHIGLGKNETFVGIHVRRTDKLEIEGDYYPLSKYMAKVDRYYDQIDIQAELKGINRTKRNIYLATDDEQLWKKELPTYSSQEKYKFFGSEQFTANAQPQYRDRVNSMEELAIDVWILSMSDYLVCTFSSQICRLAYELMQIRRPNGRDMSNKVYSLDDPYYYGGQITHGLRAFVSNKNGSSKEHSFKSGGILGISKDHKNGYLYGDLRYQDLYQPPKKFPKYKVVENVVTYPFRLFDEYDGKLDNVNKIATTR